MRLLIRSIAVLTLSLGTLACAQGPASSQGTQEKTMEGHPPSAADVRSEQDKAAASADRAADEASRRAAPNAVVSGDYPPLPQGPALTSGALVEAIVRMAKSFETRADMAPTHVALVSGLEVTSDSQGRRTGLQGSLGGGTTRSLCGSLTCVIPAIPSSSQCDRPKPATCRSNRCMTHWLPQGLE